MTPRRPLSCPHSTMGCDDCLDAYDDYVADLIEADTAEEVAS